MRAPALRAPAVLLRILAAVPGGYALTAAGVALLGAALSALGMARSEAVVLAAMLGFVLYLVFLLWAFSVRSLLRLCAVVLLGTAAACGVLWLLA